MESKGEPVKSGGGKIMKMFSTCAIKQQLPVGLWCNSTRYHTHILLMYGRRSVHMDRFCVTLHDRDVCLCSTSHYPVAAWQPDLFYLHHLLLIHRENMPLWISMTCDTSWPQWHLPLTGEENEQAFVHCGKWKSNEGLDKIVNDPVTTCTFYMQ